MLHQQGLFDIYGTFITINEYEKKNEIEINTEAILEKVGWGFKDFLWNKHIIIYSREVIVGIVQRG